MLEAGLPVLDQYSQHHATALHWTGFNGNAELARLILKYNPPLEDADNQYQGTPLNWAIYGSVNGWHPEQGDYAGVVEALLDAGASVRDAAGEFRTTPLCPDSFRSRPLPRGPAYIPRRAAIPRHARRCSDTAR